MRSKKEAGLKSLPHKAEAAVTASILCSETKLHLIVTEFDGSDLGPADTAKHFKTNAGSAATSWNGSGRCAVANISEYHPRDITIETDLKANYRPFRIINTTKSSIRES